MFISVNIQISGSFWRWPVALPTTLKSYGVQKGERVAIYMPVSPMAVAAMLACARIGAVHTVVFAGFSSEALAGRIQDGE